MRSQTARNRSPWPMARGAASRTPLRAAPAIKKMSARARHTSVSFKPALLLLSVCLSRDPSTVLLVSYLANSQFKSSVPSFPSFISELNLDQNLDGAFFLLAPRPSSNWSLGAPAPHLQENVSCLSAFPMLVPSLSW